MLKSKVVRALAAVALFGTLLACGAEDLVGGFKTPSIASLTPNAGVVGSTITIQGAFLSNGNTPYQVSFNGVIATNVSTIDDVQIQVQVPVGATSGPVVVTNLNGGDPKVSNSQQFTVVSNQ